MCAAVDMIASPHYFYSHSPPAGFLADFAMPPHLPPHLPPTKKPLFRGISAPILPKQLKTIRIQLGAAPRSILRAENGIKKNVSFADDKGQQLERVRVMTEPSHVPPFWLVADDRSEARHGERDRWECRFTQPASDYVGFRSRITDESVSLENVIIKEREGFAEGTVKVKNLDYNKEVFVRTTADGWRSHEDTYCAFSECGPCLSGIVSLYDTFAFRLQLPIHSRRLEFCVCFGCSGQQFWDNNRGENYVLEKTSVRAAPGNFCGGFHSGNSWSARTDTGGNTPYW